ncbi:MAG: ubiquinol oxidase subunit II [Candidatus Rhabdochlamydia sp.]
MKLKQGIITAVFVGVLIALASYVNTLLGQLNLVVLNPKGAVGVQEKELFLTAFYLMLIVVIPVFFLALLFAIRYRAKGPSKTYAPDLEHNHVLEILWWVIPLIIVTILAVMAYKSSYTLNPYKPLESKQKPVVIQVIALEWKWLFIYPKYNIASVGEIVFPEGTPLQFDITADAPMNSFWIPELGGQIYAMGGMKTQLHLIANETGEFQGMSSNFSGKGFSEMTFKAKSVTQDQFDQWIKTVQETSLPLNQEEYSRLKVATAGYPVTFYKLEDDRLFEKVLMQETSDQVAS